MGDALCRKDVVNVTGRYDMKPFFRQQWNTTLVLENPSLVRAMVSILGENDERKIAKN